MNNLILIFAIIPSFLLGQSWEKTYGGLYDDVGYSIRQSSDGTFTVTGFSEVQNNDNDVYLFKINNNGELLWSRSYDDEGHEIGLSLALTNDGGYIITGFTSETPFDQSDIYIIKTDADGNKVWSKTYGGNENEKGLSVQQTVDGGYIVTGYTESYGTGPSDIYIVKTDSNGDSLWTKNFGCNNSDYGSSVLQTDDGGYIIAGTTKITGERSKMTIVKIDSDGDSLWAKKYGGDNTTTGNCISGSSDGGYVISGKIIAYDKSTDGAYLVKISSEGDPIWTKIYSGNFVYYEAGSSQQTNDEGYIINGSIYLGDANYDIYLIKTDSFGDTLWIRKFGGTGLERSYYVQQIFDGGYVLAGYILSNGIADAYIIKTDQNGLVTFTSEIPFPNANRKLLKIIDVSGKEITKPLKNKPYIEIYDDGTTKKKMNLK